MLGGAVLRHFIEIPFLLVTLLAMVVGLPASADTGEVRAYQLGAGDTVTVSVYEENELSGTFAVGDDGYMDFPLLGRIDVAGKTETDLDDTLTAALGSKFIRDPQVTVKVSAFGSQPVQVLGAVKRPGVFHLAGTTTVLDIIAKAGGVREAGITEVRIQHKDSAKPATQLNLEKVVAGSADNVQLAAGDVIYVSEGLVVYVSGEVAKPGALPFSDGLTVTQALTRSGGTKRTAKLQDAYILRGEQRIPINLKRIMAGRAADVLLRPDDQIILKESVF